MSRIGQDNESAEQRRKLNRENQKSSAKGNKPVASAKGGSSEEPQMRSVNESPRIENTLIPKVNNTIHRILDNEQMATNLKDTNVIAQQMGVNPQAQAVVQNPTQPIVTTADKVTAAKKAIAEANNPQFKEYNYTEFNRQQAGDIVKNDLGFQEMLQLVRDQTKAQEENVKKTSKYAKASAWGNLFHALGQLAGLGKNTYAKPESKYLQSALAKADEARALYDKMKADNAMYIAKAETAYLDKLEAQHNAKEKMKADAIEKYNETLRKSLKDKEDVALDQAKLVLEAQKAKIQEDYNNGRISLEEFKLKMKQAEKDAKDAAARGKAYSKMQKDAYISFVDYADDNKEYYLSESRALDIANIMIDSGVKEHDLGLIESQIKGGLEIKDKTKLKARVLDFLKKNAHTNEEVKNILDYVSADNEVLLKGYASQQDSENDEEYDKFDDF